MCTRCGKVSVDSRCEACKRNRREDIKARRSAGLCTTGSCKNDAVPGKAKCKNCNDYHAKWRAENKWRRKKTYYRRKKEPDRLYCKSTRPLIDFLDEFDSIL